MGEDGAGGRGGNVVQAQFSAREFAEALSPLAEDMGMARPDLAQMEARTLVASLPPDELALRCADLLGAKDGRHGLFSRNGELVAWDKSRECMMPMIAKRFRTWITTARGIMILKAKIKHDQETGKPIIIKGELKKDSAEMILASDVLNDAVPKITGSNPVRLPVMAGAGGEIRLLQPGYDRETGVWTGEGLEYDLEMNGMDGAEHLHMLYHTFSWRDPGRDFAIHLASMLTMFCRGLYTGKAPMFVYNANIQNSGKTNLAWQASWAVHGTRRCMVLMEDGETELIKQLNSHALAQSPYVIFDNVKWDGVVETPVLDEWISGEEHDQRIMGGNTVAAPKIAGMTLMTGNGVKLSADLQRRARIADLYNPLAGEDRTLPKGAVLVDSAFFADVDQRRKVLASLWSLVRMWDAAGRPGCPGGLLGTFEGWSRVIPGIVYHAGKIFEKEWNCMAESQNEEVGDKVSRDWKRLALGAMEAFGKDEDGVMMPRFEVTVKQLAGLARRTGNETAVWPLYPEKDIESVKRCREFHFTSPPDMELNSPEENAERDRQASEFFTGKSSSAFGIAVKKALDMRQFKGADGAFYQWDQRKGVAPARYGVERKG